MFRRGGARERSWLGTVNWKCVHVCDVRVRVCVENALVTQSSIDRQG